MSNRGKSNKVVRKRMAFVEEVEEVQTVDRRGNVRSQNDFLWEWVPKRESFLQLLLELEDKWNDGLIQKWNGKYFAKTTLHDQGYILHLDHHGGMCPDTEDPWLDVEETLPGMDNVDLLQDGIEEQTKNVLEDGLVNIVHTTGVFKHKVRWCQCQSAPDKTVQLFELRLFPASDRQPETAFTFDVLEHFHIDAMECKTAAASFIKKLRHLTNNAFPHMVPWRDLQSRKWFGFGHNMKTTPQNGNLAHFCPACPQPGINLPDDWKNQPKQWLFWRSIVVDGNFHADHLKMRHPENDVTLADGLAFMVETKPYLKHISESRDIKQACFLAMNAANLDRKNRDATGIGACACARHGSFVPHTVVDFQKGERQMNMDYAICNALKYQSFGLPQALPTDIQRLGLGVLATQELELRKGQASDCLQNLRMALGHKADLYRTKVRKAKTSVDKTRIWDDVKAITVKINKHIRAYRRARKALQHLGADNAILLQYQELQSEHLKLSADITEENRFGQRSDVLPWFWRLGGQNEDQHDTWMEEFYCVNWLRAKTRQDRWKEELLIVQHEMKWTVRWFKHQIKEWTARLNKSVEENKPGHTAYAEKQIAMWKMFTKEAERGFCRLMAN
ncbi:hypothetical protein BJV77DRAFT_966605 [Russula vinacea]|nr:hypothetical protein BJV77DRAFT_966605 [Russula vinacea]